MVKSAQEKALEKKYAEAVSGKDKEIHDAQIEVYEGQVTEARDAYYEATEKRSKARSKLPKDIPEESEIKEKLLEAQYIKRNISSPTEREQISEYEKSISDYRVHKKTVSVLDKEIPQLKMQAEEEVKAVNRKIQKAKETETTKQDSLIEGYSTQIGAIRKAEYISQKNQQSWIVSEATALVKKEDARLEQKRIAEEAKALKLKQEADIREKAFREFKGGKTAGKQIHYGRYPNIPYGHGEISPAPYSRGTKGGKIYWIIEDSYYQRAGSILGISAEQARSVARHGMVTGSGKSRDKALRSVQDSIDGGNRAEQYAQHRALAKKTTASAYANMSAQEKLTSSSTATMFATSHDMSASEISQKNEAKKTVQLEALSDMTNGLLGGKKRETAKQGEGTFQVFEKDGTNVTDKAIPIINKQRETELANVRQQQYVSELRAGNIGLARALLDPQTKQTYTNSTMNTDKFLTERGYDTSKPDTIPTNLFSPDYNEKLTEARQTTQGDLRTATSGYTGKTNQPYTMPKASMKVQTKRKEAQAVIAKFDPKPMDQFKAKDSSYVPSVGTVTLKKNELLTKKETDVWGFDPIANATNKDMQTTWTVPIKTKNAEYTADFKTREEAVLFKKSQEKVFSGTDNDLWNKFQYASAVDSGEVIHPRETPTLTDDVRYYASVVNRPLVNLGASVVNLTQDKQVPIYQTGAERLIGGTIDDTLEGQPLRGTGVTGAYNYVAEDPLRAVLELPAEAVMWVAGGKAVSLGVKGIGAGKTILSNAKFIPQPVKAVGTKIESGVTVIQKAPENVWLKGTEASTTLKGIDKSLAYVGGQRVGMGTAMNLRYTFGGRKLLKEARTTSRKVNQPIPLMEGKIFTIKQIEDPVVIKSKNVIEVPIKETDESIFHVRNTQQTAQAVKVGNVQQYYKTATPNFINVSKQGLSLPKAPKLPSLDPMKKWVAKTQKNVKLVEAKGYGAMLSGGNVKLKAVEKGMKIKDAKQIAQAEVEGKIRDAKLMALGKKYQAEQQWDNMITSGKKVFADPVSRAKFTNNAWNKLSQTKAVTRDRLSQMKKGITDRPATEELILYREATESTATKSIAKSTAEPLTVKSTPIKTSITHTKTPTDFTTTYGLVPDERMIARGITMPDGSPIMKMGYTNKEGSLFVTKQVDSNLQIVGEQVRIPFKDYKTIKSVDQANLDRLYEQGKYAVLEKGKLVEKKVEVRALQQEDSDKTLIRRNTLTGTGEKIQESSVREWGGTRKTLYGDVEVGGQKSDVILKSLNKKVLTTKLSPLTKPKKPSVVGQRQTSQTDDTAVWTGGSTSGNPMTGKGTTVPEFGGKGKPSAPEKTGTFDPRTGTVTVNKSNIISSPVKGKAKEIMKDYSTTWKSTKSPYNKATVGSATVSGITIDTVSGLTPKDMIKTGVDTGVRIDTGIQGKIDTKVETGLKQDTVQKTLTEQQSRLRSDTKLKLDTGLKQKQMTTNAQIPLLRSPLVRSRARPKALPIILPRIDLEDKPAKRGKRGKKKGFIGNVRLDNIMGVYKRKEITYGQKKVRKLERLDMRLTAKTPDRISQPSSKLLKSKKKKKPKTETDLLGSVSLKSKSEFKGFTEKKTTKKKSKRKSKKKISLI